ncbi:YIP1 family protein [Sulfitobacter sp. F26169L]|uniref:YIP1 family protein n=1 Tax=Sulfitobacter sp. F26169L TaxID=2996015 RepID=UPI002260DF0E|nr:YIP1 family protein [Sulfitobacter sp. F26169L]MCX7565447.1 YIP1 family protein [Sulfitobacter sp. F26169L]
MALTQDILATYKGPGRVVSRFLAQGRNEVRALLFLLIAGMLMFVATAPFQAREAQLNPEVPLAARLYWSAFFFVFIMPILVYLFAILVRGLAWIARRKVTGFEIRFTLIWALLASTPVILLTGLTAAFIGPGIQLQLLGFVWLAVFGWFWASGLLRAEG